MELSRNLAKPAKCPERESPQPTFEKVAEYSEYIPPQAPEQRLIPDSRVKLWFTKTFIRIRRVDQMTLTKDKVVTTSTQFEEELDNAILKLERESLTKVLP